MALKVAHNVVEKCTHKSQYVSHLSGTEGLVGFCSLSTQSVHASQPVTSPHALRRRHLAVQDIMLRPYPHL